MSEEKRTGEAVDREKANWRPLKRGRPKKEEEKQ
jgi:hypothetical protein